MSTLLGSTARIHSVRRAEPAFSSALAGVWLGRRVSWLSGLFHRVWNVAFLQLHEFLLGNPRGPQNGYSRQRPANHRHFVASVEPRAGLAILVDLVRQRGAIGNPKAEVEEEVRNTRKQAHGYDALLLRLLQETTQQTPASSLPLGLGLHNDGADL